MEKVYPWMFSAARGSAQIRRRRVGDQRGQHALRRAHVDAPQRHPGQQHAPVIRRREQQVGGDQEQQAERQKRSMTPGVRLFPERIGCRRIHEVHGDHHQRNQRQGDAGIMGA